MMKNFSTQNLRNVFAEENKFDSYRRVSSNLIQGIDTYELDDNGNERCISAADANKAIRKVWMEICGLTEEDLRSRKKVQRARHAHEVELYELIEADIELVVNRGLQASEWFNSFVESKSHALGDANSFYMEAPDQYLIVGNYSGDHHDVTMQQLGEGEEFSVRCTSHTIKIGKDIDLILLGRYDYQKLVNKIAESYLKDIQETIFADVYAASTKLPASMKGSGALSSSTKSDFDELIELASIVNDSDVMIIGTKMALKKITALADVDWATVQMKEEIALNGRLGSYEGTTLMEVPQRLKLGVSMDSFNAATDLLLPNDKLLIVPVGVDKFVKFYDEGETQIFDVTQKADLKDDFETHEVRRDYGHEIILGRYFAEWTLE